MHRADEEWPQRRRDVLPVTSNQRRDPEADEHERHAELERERESRRHRHAQRDKRTSNQQDADGVADAPPGTYERRTPRRSAVSLYGDRANGREVVGVRRVTNAEHEAERERRKQCHAGAGGWGAGGWREDKAASSSTPMLRLAAVIALSFAPALRSVPLPHTGLKRSEPAKNSKLTTPPKRISLWFTAKPQLAFTRISLDGPGGRLVLDTIVADTGNALHAQVPRVLQPGTYTIHWQTASADGHAIRGDFSFTITGSTAVDTAVRPPPAAAGQPVEEHHHDEPATEPAPQMASEYRSVRWFEFAAMLTILGALGFRHAVLPPLAVRGVMTSDAADRARRLGRIAIVVSLVAALIRLVAETLAMHGAGGFFGSVSSMLVSTTWGVGWILGAVGAALLLLGWTIPRRIANDIGTPLALTGAIGIVLAPALSGHAAASRWFVPSVTLDALHVAAAGLWIGGLLIVATIGIPAMQKLEGNPDGAVRALFSSFHPLALFCAPLVVIAGLATSWMRLGSVEGLRTFYGTALLVKLGLFAMVAGLGAYNAFRARKRLGTPDGTSHLRRTASVELVVAALVLVATTFLVVSPVPMEMP